MSMKKLFHTVILFLSLILLSPAANALSFNVVVLPADLMNVCDNYYCYPEVSEIIANDLIQYLIAVDRVNQEVAELYDPCHPAVLRTINFIVQACRKKGKPVSICGEMASDPDMVPFLIGLGVDILSLSPRMFLRIKSALRGLNFEDCSNLAQAAILMSSSEEIRNLKDTYNGNE